MTSCLEPASNGPKVCISKSTNLRGAGPGSAFYLDRHLVSCSFETEGFVNQFKLVWNSDHIQYEYTCCK